MTTFALIPGAGGLAWYWHRVVPLLAAAGHEAIPVDLPAEVPTAGSVSSKSWTPKTRLRSRERLFSSSRPMSRNFQ